MCLETKNYQKTNSYLNILDKTIRNSLHKSRLNLDKSDSMKQTFSLNSNFSLNTNPDGSKSIEGFAIHGGEDFIVNGFFEVPESEMRNCAQTLKGAKLLKDHDSDHVDSIIGRVNQTKSTFDENADMAGVHYNASLVVDDTKLAEKIEKGLIDATSIGFTFEPECSICGNPFFSEECTHHPWFDDMHFVCRDMNVHELSLVTFGADPNATVSGSFDEKSLEELKEKFAKQKEDFIMQNEDNMVETLKTENLELSQKVTDLEAELKQKEADFKSQEDNLKVEHKEEVLTLKQEKDALQAKVDDMTEELSVFRAEAKAQAEQELAAKKEKLAELAERFGAEDLLEDEMTEELIDKQIAMLERVADKVDTKETVPQFKAKQTQHHASSKETKEHVAFSGVSKYFPSARTSQE